MWRWALRDVHLDVAPGEAVGLIGANGSGKTTLLRVLTRVMYPEAGRLSVAGRVGALIEVRAGIHPDLTGRENVYLYGALLGLRRRQIDERFDRIVDFAELPSAIDRQVKFYSTGMQMRLGFAVAAFLEPDILLVDEVLAVGDAAFQQKCLDRMRDVLTAGTTIIFVSHDLPAVEALCQRAVWLDAGVIRADEAARRVLGEYRHAIEQGTMFQHQTQNGSAMRLAHVRLSHGGGHSPSSHAPLRVDFSVASKVDRAGVLYMGVSEGPATPIFVVNRPTLFREGDNRLSCEIQDLPLPGGRFCVWVGVFAGNRDLLPWQPVADLDVVGPALDPTPVGVLRPSPVQVRARWEDGHA
jgi:ABC-type polysaccharide/polyol phosphate transport system ATPase subunit